MCVRVFIFRMYLLGEWGVGWLCRETKKVNTQMMDNCGRPGGSGVFESAGAAV